MGVRDGTGVWWGGSKVSGLQGSGNRDEGSLTLTVNEARWE